MRRPPMLRLHPSEPAADSAEQEGVPAVRPRVLLSQAAGDWRGEGGQSRREHRGDRSSITHVIARLFKGN